MKDIIDINELKNLLKNFVEVRDWGKFHNPKNLSMALLVEPGELMEIFQWMADNDSANARHSALIREKTSHELADIIFYVIHIAAAMRINLSEAIYNKLKINDQKYPPNLVKGSAKKYSDYS